MSWLEHAECRRAKPAPIAPSDLTRTVAPPRFCISERQGLEEPKYWAIDGLFRSHVIPAARPADTYCPKGMGALATHDRELAKLCNTGFGAWLVSFSKRLQKRSDFTNPQWGHPQSVLRTRTPTYRTGRESWPDRSVVAASPQNGQGFNAHAIHRQRMIPPATRLSYPMSAALGSRWPLCADFGRLNGCPCFWGFRRPTRRLIRKREPSATRGAF